MKAVFFDLDNTLYDTKKYNLRAFKSISEFLEEKYNQNSNEVYEILKNYWEKKTSMYPKLFDDILKKEPNEPFGRAILIGSVVLPAICSRRLRQHGRCLTYPIKTALAESGLNEEPRPVPAAGVLHFQSGDLLILDGTIR